MLKAVVQTLVVYIDWAWLGVTVRLLGLWGLQGPGGKGRPLPLRGLPADYGGQEPPQEKLLSHLPAARAEGCTARPSPPVKGTSIPYSFLYSLPAIQLAHIPSHPVATANGICSFPAPRTTLDNYEWSSYWPGTVPGALLQK